MTMRFAALAAATFMAGFQQFAMAQTCSSSDLYAEAYEAREDHRVYCTTGDRNAFTCHDQIANEKRERMELAEAALKKCRAPSDHEALYYNTLYLFPMLVSAAKLGVPEYERALRSQIRTFERLYNEGYSKPACLLSAIYEEGLPGIGASPSRTILWGQRCVEVAATEGRADDAFAALDRLRNVGAHQDVLNALQERVQSLK